MEEETLVLDLGEGLLRAVELGLKKTSRDITYLSIITMTSLQPPK